MERSVSEKIQKIKQKMGDSLTILAHHYQRDEIVQHADFVGDSLELARKISSLNARYIIMCGVYFMAESSAILAKEDQKVFIPVAEAGCTLADLAPGEMVEIVLQRLNQERKIIPIAYVNTSAKVKAICAKFGGSVCTSANSTTMLKWAITQGDGVLFLPDKNLGINTARSIGIDEQKVCDMSDKIFERDYVLYLWPGLCDVHLGFRTEHIINMRKSHPKAKIIVHPECPPEIVEVSDEWGSTSKIINYIDQIDTGSEVIVGTEINLVNRLKNIHYPDKIIYPLSNSKCKYMEMIGEKQLLTLLENLEKQDPVYIDPETKKLAKLAINRMLDICAK